MFPVSTLRSAYAPATSNHPPPIVLPLAGWFAGLIGLGGYWIGTVLFPPPYLPVLLSMAATAGLTMARPEHSFALFAGGPDTDPKTDAQASGLFWLIVLVFARFFAIQALFANEAFGLTLALKFIMAHSLSHLMAASMSWSSTQAGRPPASHRLVAIGIGLLPMLVLIGLTTLWIYSLFLIPLLLLRWRLVIATRQNSDDTVRYSRGAVQQLSELIVYLSFVSLLWVSI